MIDVSTLFFLMAAVIGLGFLGAWLFKLTRVPEVMLLIGAGVAPRSAASPPAPWQASARSASATSEAAASACARWGAIASAWAAHSSGHDMTCRPPSTTLLPIA